jgi:hypothetical protein
MNNKHIMLAVIAIASVCGLIVILFLANPITKENNKDEKRFKIEASYPSGAYFPLDNAVTSVTIKNQTGNAKEVWTDMKVLNHLDQVVYSQIAKSWVNGESETTQDIGWTIPQDVETGSYHVEITVWDQSPENKGAMMLSKVRSTEKFMCYHTQEEFKKLDATIWTVSNKTLGRTELKSKNVTADNGKLKITMPARKLEGGEIATIASQEYGAYEIRMKLPNAPSSITGFFLYEAPDYEYELDIEVFNQPDGKLLLTTYADGAVQNKYEGDLSFDPTAGFHNYRIEYYEDRVDFYVDDALISGWTDGFPKGKMRLMINSWYPDWLDGIAVKEDQNLLVDWVRY